MIEQCNISETTEGIAPEAGKMMKRATLFSVSAAFILILVKFYAWAITGSVSMMSSLIDSGLDLVVSFINLVAVRYALMPADEDHRYGHHSAEDVAALAQAAFIAGSAAFISLSAIGVLMSPRSIEHGDVAIWVMIFSIVITAALVIYQKRVVKATGSTAIHADSLHYVGDLLVNGAVIIAIVLATQFDIHYADPIMALLIACYIVYGAWGIGKLAFDKLMDKEFDDAEKDKLIEVINAHEGVLGVHDLKTRYSGTKPFIQFHLELDGQQTLNEAHMIADGLEIKLTKLYPNSDVIIHEDPTDFKREG